MPHFMSYFIPFSNIQTLPLGRNRFEVRWISFGLPMSAYCRGMQEVEEILGHISG